jgi:hypothetical protein
MRGAASGLGVIIDKAGGSMIVSNNRDLDQYPSPVTTSPPFAVERALKTGIWVPLNMP